MDDLISRQAAIELCDWYEHDFCECDYVIKALADDLKSLPTAEKKGKWIPVTERLPDRREGAVLVTDWGDVCYAYRNDIGMWMDFDGNKLKDVTAWMPLPEPFMEEESDARENQTNS